MHIRSRFLAKLTQVNNVRRIQLLVSVMRRSAGSLKDMAKRLLPPLVVDWLRPVWQTICFGAPEWEYLPEGWMTQDPKIKGWNVKSVSRTEEIKWPEFLRLTQGTGPLGVAHESPMLTNDNYDAHHLVMTYGYVLALAARMKKQISILDWGGGIGHDAILSKCLLPNLQIEYCCKDVTSICESGSKLLHEVSFVDNEEAVLNRSFDLVLVSGSLQCVENWKSVARLLTSVTKSYLYITRLPIVKQSKSFVAVQRTYAYGYDTEHMCWFLNRGEFLDHFASLQLELVREFVFEKHPAVKNAPERAEIRGFLFCSK